MPWRDADRSSPGQHERFMTFDALVHAGCQRAPDEPAWRSVARVLANEIRDGMYAEGARLPGEAALAQRLAVNRHVMRQAMAQLQAQGLIEIQPGRGSFVRRARLDYTLALRTRFGDNMRRQGTEPSRQLLSVAAQGADEALCLALTLPRQAQVLAVETLDEADGEPLGLARAYYPLPRFALAEQLLVQGLGHTALLHALGIDDYVRARTSITAQPASASVARWLKQEVGRPVLCVRSWDHDLQGTCIKYGETLFCADRVQLVHQGVQ